LEERGEYKDRKKETVLKRQVSTEIGDKGQHERRHCFGQNFNDRLKEERDENGSDWKTNIW
jgi:hypothetical protein